MQVPLQRCDPDLIEELLIFEVPFVESAFLRWINNVPYNATPDSIKEFFNAARLGL